MISSIRRMFGGFLSIFKKRKNVKLGIYGPPNAGKCLTQDTSIILYNGEIKTIKKLFDEIREIKSEFSKCDKFEDFEETYLETSDLGILVPSLDPKTLKIVPKKMQFVYAQKHKGQVYKITTTSGRIIEGTSEHPIIRISNEGIKRVKLCELNKSECIGITANLSLNTNIILNKIKEENYNINNNNNIIQSISKFHPHTKSINIPQVLDGDLVSFIGYVITESNHIENRIKFTNSDKGLLEHFEYLSEKLFNLKTIKRDMGNNNFELELNSKTLTDYLTEILGFKPNLSGDKEIPAQLMGLSNNISAQLLKVLFDAEGYVPENAKDRGAEIEYSSKSKKLVEQVQILLNKFGIVGKFKTKIVNNEEYHSLFIGGSDNHRLFRDNIGFTILYKKERLNKICNTGLKRNRFYLPIMKLLEKLRLSENKLQKEFYLDDKHIRRMINDNKITYHRLRAMALKSNNEILRSLANADCMWDEIKDIEIKEYDDYVYDITVEDNHTFLLSNGLISGNSTLANRICKDWLGEEMSSVSAIPHETREIIIKEKITIKSKGKELTFNLVDTPGIATKIDYEDFIRFKMTAKDAKERAKEATKGVIDAIKWLDNMDCVLVVLDASQNPYSQVNITIIGNLAARNIPVLIVANKIDLKKSDVKRVESAFPQYPTIGISAEKGHNIENFYDELFKIIK